MFKKILIVIMIGCFLLGMATRKEVENVRKTVDSAEVAADSGELKIDLVYEIESVSDYLMSKDGEVLLYTPKTTGQTRASEVKILNISEDPKNKVLSFKKTRSTVDIDPEVLESPWTKLFEEKIIYRDRYPSGDIITKKLDGRILSEIPCDYEIWEPVISPAGKYVAIIPSIDAQYPSLQVYETETGKKLWEKFTPDDIYYGGEGAPSFLIEATFITDDSLVVYYDGKIWLFDVKSGRTHWGKEIFRPSEEYSWVGSFISVVENGDIIFFGSVISGSPSPDRLFCLSGDGKIQWQKVDIGATEISPTSKYVVIFLGRHLFQFTDAKSGTSLWNKKMTELGGIDEVFCSLKGEYTIIKGDLEAYPDYNIFIIKSASGEVIEKFKGIRIFFSPESNILSFKNGDTLFFYRLSQGDNK